MYIVYDKIFGGKAAIEIDNRIQDGWLLGNDGDFYSQVDEHLGILQIDPKDAPSNSCRMSMDTMLGMLAKA